MKNKLDTYDTNKLNKARELILQVYEYNYMPSTPLTKKLDTVIRKLENIIENEQKEPFYWEE